MLDKQNQEENEEQKDQNIHKRRRLKDILNPDNFIIPMSSGWKAIFDTFVLFVVAYSIISTLLFVCFNPVIEPDDPIKYVDNFVLVVFAIDFVLNFFTEYQDQETFKKVRSIKKIAMRYLKSGWMLIDFIATFPIDKVVGQEGKLQIFNKLFRLTRLTRLWALLDLSRVNRLLKQLFETSQRQDRIVAQYILMYGYKIFRLIIIAIIITYFVGCFWYVVVDNVNSQEDIDNGKTFLQTF